MLFHVDNEDSDQTARGAGWSESAGRKAHFVGFPILGSGNILSLKLVMKSFLQPFSFRVVVSYWRKDVHWLTT